MPYFLFFYQDWMPYESWDWTMSLQNNFIDLTYWFRSMNITFFLEDRVLEALTQISNSIVLVSMFIMVKGGQIDKNNKNKDRGTKSGIITNCLLCFWSLDNNECSG